MGGRDYGLQVGKPNQCAYKWGNQTITPACGDTTSNAKVNTSVDNATLDNDDRMTDKMDAECEAFGKAYRICNKVHHMIMRCDERPTNTVVITSDDEDGRNIAKPYEMYNTLDKILTKRGFNQDDQDKKFTLPVHEPTNIVTTACCCKRDGEDAACLRTADEEQNYRFKAY